MSIQEDANLILKLYDLRREETMRKARDWFFRGFNPETAEDYTVAMFGEHSGHLRMVSSYWEMAATMVNHGAINLTLFNETNGEHFAVFAKVEKLLPELRQTHGQELLKNLEKLVDATPGGRERCAKMRDRMKEIRAQMLERAANA